VHVRLLVTNRRNDAEDEINSDISLHEGHVFIL
jgi:hypothetical protein